MPINIFIPIIYLNYKQSTGLAFIGAVSYSRVPLYSIGVNKRKLKGDSMDIHIKGQERAQYLKGDSWRCSSSPSGAHHWIIQRQTICKYCHMVQQPQNIQSDKDTVIHPAVIKPILP